MSVNARPASAQFEVEIQMDSDDRPMSQDAEPNAGPDAEPDAEPNAEPNAKPDAEPDAKSNIRQVTHSPSGRELQTWISESEWTDYIKHVPHVPRIPTSAVLIFRVPEVLKKTKKEAYVPQRVSLGPYHHRIAKFSPMGHYKGRALRGMMEKYNKEKGLDSDPYNINMDFANHAKGEILKVEKEMRDSYEENIDCDGETLARMLCLDGCFLLEVLRTLGRDESLGADSMQLGNKENEIIVFSSRDIVNDVLMLENQVPFIVLRKLLRLELNSTSDDDFHKLLSKMVMGWIRRLLEPSYPFRYYIEAYLEKWPYGNLAGEEVQHLLSFLYEAIVFLGFGPIEVRGLIEDMDRGPVCSIFIDCLDSCMYSDRCPVCSMCIDCLCRRMCIDCVDRIMQYQVPNHFQRILPAVELRNAGIKFKGSIKKIKFDRKSATIFLPHICITDITEVLFRNLIAFEVCRPSQMKYVSCYVNIMDNLIDSEKDVALLRRMGVLTNRLGRDNEVVDLFNGLSKAAAPMNQFDGFHLLAERVNAHYENEIRVQLQLPKLVQDYCSTPWKALASAAAIVLLVLALLQTIFSAIAVYK